MHSFETEQGGGISEAFTYLRHKVAGRWRRRPRVYKGKLVSSTTACGRGYFKFLVSV